jgi:Tol biopolymer transport system component
LFISFPDKPGESGTLHGAVVPLSPHTRLGPYEILAALGAGGMGEVYKARDTRLDRTVAIKILPEHISAKPQARERFEREARAVSSLNHPHICTLHDVGHQDGIDFLVMEYLEGETLAQRLKKGPLPPEQVLQYAIQVAEALDTAHKHGVIHRDLKPGNIMLTKTGVKLLDFGLAKVRAAGAVAGATALPTETAPLTGEGTILGTLQYMAPEQLEGKEADARTDIFALGAVIYEMATGRKAFEGKSHASLIAAILEREPPAISTLQAMASPALDHVVRTCLAKEPEMRWQGAHDVLVELKWIAEGGAASQAPAGGTTRFRKREWLGWVAATCLFAALAMTLAIVYLRPVPEGRVVQFEVALPEKATLGGYDYPVISPDGQHVAVSFTSAGQSRIWLRALNSSAMTSLAGTEGGVFPFWSPDSRQIAFSTESAVKKVSLTGGAPQTICNGKFAPRAWSRNGVILLSPAPNGPIYKVSAMGGEPKPATKLDPSRKETSHAFPSFLPDGQHFIYLAMGGQPSTYLASLDSPEVRRIREGNTNAVYAFGHLLFMRSQSLMAQRFDLRKAELSGDPILVADQVLVTPGAPWGYYTVSENGVLAYRAGSGERTQLVWYDRAGKRLKTASEPAEYSNPALSPDQKKVAVSKRDPQTHTRDIWIIDLERGASSRFTFDPAEDSNPTWSPDGTRIAFWSDRKGHNDIYMKQATGAGDEELVSQSDEEKYVEDWSTDGQYLFAGDDAEWLFSFRDHKVQPFVRAQFVHDQYRFCPNGNQPPRWFAYRSVEGGVSQVYVRSFAGTLSGSGGKWLISTDGGEEPHWRGDGKELFYLNGNKLMAVGVNGDGVSFQPGIPKELFETPPLGEFSEFRRNCYDVTSDGKRFLINLLAEQPSNSFTVVLNWPARLKH